jgi:hypothetical protein
MKRLAPLLLLSLLFFTGCSSQDIYIGRVGFEPFPAGKDLWGQLELLTPENNLRLRIASGDILLEGAGEIVAVREAPDEPGQLVLTAWQDGILTVYHLDLQLRQATALAAVNIPGPAPKLTGFQWPQLLFQGQDGEGNFHWLLLDLVQEPEILWQHHAFVPPAFRREPLWHHQGRWFLAPLQGPVIQEVISGNRFPLDEAFPLREGWPRWAGPGAGCFIYPGQGREPRRLDLTTGSCLPLEVAQDFAWNRERTLLACRGESIILYGPQGREELPLNVQPGPPLWADDEDFLYFLGGEKDFFGLVWREIWLWDLVSEPQAVLALPGYWGRWRLVQASSLAVLAAAGEKLNTWYYFDLELNTQLTLKPMSQYLWFQGHLLAVTSQGLIRISPGMGRHFIQRSDTPLEIIGLAGRFLVYRHDGQVRIRQLIL